MSCDDRTVGTFDIAAGSRRVTVEDVTAASRPARTAGSNETEDGSTSTVNVTVTRRRPDRLGPAGGIAHATISDSYTLANGSLIVHKTIDGPAAGQQGEIVIEVSCDGNALEDFVIPAGTTGPQSKDYQDLPAGSQCTVTETADGSTAMWPWPKRAAAR